MNIFVLDYNIKKCAQAHVNRHCVKMILETAQLLSTAHRVLDGTKKVIIKNSRKKTVWDLHFDNQFYQATHINHPCAKWVRESVANYKWTVALLKELCAEYTFRYGKVHKVEQIGLLKSFEKVPSIQSEEMTPFALAMPDDCKTDDAVQSYRNYYIRHKQHLADWKVRDKPEWY